MRRHVVQGTVTTGMVALVALVVIAGCGGANEQGPKGAPPPMSDPAADEGPLDLGPAIDEPPLPPSPVALDPAPGADVKANEINEEGKALVQKRDFEGALERFRAALRLFPLSNAVFNVGSMLYTLGKLHEAFPYLQQTLKAPLAPEQRQIVVKYRDDVLARLKATHKDILVETNPPGARLVLDGEALPFPTPTRVLVPYGKATIVAHYPGFARKQVIVQSAAGAPPSDVSVRLARQIAEGLAVIRCPPGADVFVDSAIRGHRKVRVKLSAGKHTVRCGKGDRSKAFERPVVVQAGKRQTFDYSTDRE